MAEPDKHQFGDGSDNYSQAASDLVRAANEARNQAASAAAGASVSGGIKVGKAVAGIAKGAAAGGPWGAIASAAWSMRHTLYKLLVCTALFFLFIIVTIVSLPSIVTNGVFGLDGSKPVEGATLTDTYGEMAAAVSAAVNHGYDLSLAEADRLIEAGGYDYKLSMDSLVNYGHSSSGYYPFGTQIMINGVMYTVEDRGGPGIEDNIHRVDIFVPDHQEALRLGTYNTTAYIYRMGW